jgi:hypothetical protein
LATWPDPSRAVVQQTSQLETASSEQAKGDTSNQWHLGTDLDV